MQEARSFFRDFACVCAGTYFVVLLATFVSVPYALERTPGEPLAAAALAPHLS